MMKKHMINRKKTYLWMIIIRLIISEMRDMIGCIIPWMNGKELKKVNGKTRLLLSTILIG